MSVLHLQNRVPLNVPPAQPIRDLRTFSAVLRTGPCWLLPGARNSFGLLLSAHVVTFVSNPLPNSFKVKTLHVSGQIEHRTPERPVADCTRAITSLQYGSK